MKYRPEIDGLRAVAVLSVLIFHSGWGFSDKLLLPGGFLGVDVFFVISGYLITFIISSQIQNNKFSFITFYERRARRLFPVLAFVSLSTLPFGWLLMTAEQFKSLGKGLIALSFFSSNIFFWKHSGYFSESTELSPLVHTWSLAVEEQFYLIFPFCLILLLKFKKKIVPILVLLSVCSLLFAEWASFKHPSMSFYLLPSRCWELLAGATLAVFEQSFNVKKIDNKKIKEFLLFLGMTCLLGSFLLFSEKTPHPTVRTLPVILGTLLLIKFGREKNLISSILSSRIFVGIGLISYSLYLWHQPLLAYAKLHWAGSPPTWFNVLYLPISILISVISWRFVEQPLRKSKKLKGQLLIYFTIFLFSLLILAGSVIIFKKGFPSRISLPQHVLNSFKYGDGQSPPKCIDSKKSHLPEYWCDLGVKGNKKINFLLLGDSHAYAFIPGFDKAAKDESVKGFVAGASGCPPLLGVEPNRGVKGPECLKLNKDAYEFVAKNKIKNVFLVARWNYYLKGDPEGGFIQQVRLEGKIYGKSLKERTSIIMEALSDTLNRYENIGVTVHLIDQMPHQKSIPKMVYRRAFLKKGKFRFEQIKRLSISYKDHVEFSKEASFILKNTADKYKNTTYHDLSSLFCTEETCLIGEEMGTYYFDDDHLSAFGNSKLIPELKVLF